MLTDSVADALTRIRNAQRRGHHSVRVRRSKMVKAVLDVLKGEGLVEKISEVKDEETGHRSLEVVLKYYESGEPMMSSIVRVSKPGRRVYSSRGSIPRVQGGLGISILSTSKGIVSDREARKQGVGGELLATIS